ncbi:hypothetical protein M514_00372, partial [Trichuris suis]|uniref:Miro-like protein n=1 Tax=Trichuris suis TaxID=68888 RepID=A0A085MN83_9BILA
MSKYTVALFAFKIYGAEKAVIDSVFSVAFVSCSESADMVKVKIVVVGDSQVGKTSFIRSLLSLKEPNYLFLSDEQPEPTAGAKIEVFRHRYKCEYSSEDVHAVELFDIGGSALFKDIRSVFYHGTDGIIFVYSTMRSNAFTSLLSWVTEVLNKQMHGSEQLVPARLMCSDSSLHKKTQMPVLVVGTKVDLTYTWGRWGRVRHFDGILERILNCDPFAEEITLSNQVPIANGTPTCMALNRFLDRVVLHKAEPIAKPIPTGHRLSIHKWANRSFT